MAVEGMAVPERSGEEGFLEKLEAALPVDDIVGWLVREHPGATEREIMGMVQKVYQRDSHIAPAASEERTYQVGDNTWKACPQRVSRPDGTKA